MPALLISFIIFAFMLAGMLLGSILRVILPDDRTQADSKDVLMTSAGTMATLIALIIGLLVTSAKGTYDNTTATITQTGANIITLDYYLSSYGPEAQAVRALLPKAIASAIERIWPNESNHGADMAKMETETEMTTVYQEIRELLPTNESQTYFQSQALHLIDTMLQSRWMLIEQSQTELPMAFLVVLTFWLTVLFAQFSLLAPRNWTAMSALVVCAISMSGAIFLILELNQPLEGSIKVSSAPLHKALLLMTTSGHNPPLDN